MGCGQGAIFLKRSFSDIQRFEDNQITVVIDDNQADVELMLDRKNTTFYRSLAAASDATPVTMTITFEKPKLITDFFLFGTNVKDFELQYFDGSYMTLLSETTNSETNYHASLTPKTTDSVRLIMNATMTPDEEKQVAQFIITERLGQLEFRPPAFAKHKGNVLEQRMITGKSKFLENEVQHIFDFRFRSYTSVLDRQLLVTLSEFPQAALIWPGGGDESQFSFPDIGYRKKDIFLMGRSNFPSPNYTKNYYKAGTNQTLTYREVE